MLGSRSLTDELCRIRVQPEEVGRTFDDSDFLVRKFRKSIADELLHGGRIVALVDGILDARRSVQLIARTVGFRSYSKTSCKSNCVSLCIDVDGPITHLV